MNKATKLQVLDLALKLAEARADLALEHELEGLDPRPLALARQADADALAALKAALGLK